MTRATAHYLPREMAVLGLVELTLSFVMIYAVIEVAGASMPLPAFADMLPRGGIALAATLALIIGGVALIIGLYRPEVCLDRTRLLTAASLAAVISFGVLFVLDGGPRYRFGRDGAMRIALSVAAWFAMMALIRLAYGFAISRRSVPRRVVLFGDTIRVGALRARLRSRHGSMFTPVVPQGRTISWPQLRQQGIWGIVVASEPDGPTAEALLDCKLRGMRIFSTTTFHENYLGRINVDALTANHLLLGRNFGASRVSALVKRVCDIVVGVVLLALVLPVVALTAVAIKIDSRGPVFCRQLRVGQFGTTFTLFKFRSITADAEPGGHPHWAQKRDPRITRVGRFIRATRIDELPQLANVIRGEMSMVGPHPEQPHFAEQLARAIPFYRQRGYVKPGLTGWAQVNFPYGGSVEDAREELAYDLYYMKNRTILLDLIILASTVRVVLFRKDAR